MELTESEALETLAEFCHNQWSGWMEYMLKKCYMEVGQFDKPTGNLVIPQSFILRWQRQMGTEYKDLSEPEKDSDRKEARKLIYHINQKTSEKGENNMFDEPVNISNEVDGEEMPCCPLCDNEIDLTDQISLVKSSGTVGIAHKFCVEDFVETE